MASNTQFVIYTRRLTRAPRADNAMGSSSPSHTPISVTRSLSELRLTHAQLLEEHGATAALLRRREAEIRNLERREEETHQTIESLESDLRAIRQQIDHKERRANLAEREVGFLQALIVRTAFK